MKPLAALVILGMSALLVPSSLNAQRGMSGRGGGGGSHAGSGFRSGPSSGFRSAPSGGFRSAPGSFRSGPGFSTFGPVERRGGFTAFGLGRTFASRGIVNREHVFVNRPLGFRRFDHGRFGFFGDCFGCGSPFFFGSGLFLGSPFFPYYPGGYYGGYSDYYGYGPAAQQPVVVNTDNGNSAQLAAEVQQLSDEVNDLRSEGSQRYARDRAAAANSGASMSAKEPAVSTVFVFRDGHRISAQSYAIAGQTLWIFNENAARKYQVADLDAVATDQVNAANGVEFHVPAAPTNH
jgi:hypothetical protein